MSTILKKKTATVKTPYGSFVCVFEPESDMGGYAVDAPKVQGAVSWGKNFTEAKRMIAEAIAGVIEARAIVEAERQKDIGRPLLSKIIKQAGISLEHFLKL